MKNYFLLGIFLVTVTLLLVNRYTPLYINNDAVHFILLVGAAYSLVMLIGQLFGKLNTRTSTLLVFAAVLAACFLKAFLTWGGEWKTQTVLYRNRENSRMAIEYQMRGDRFSFGYKKRVVGRLPIIPSLDWITDVDTLDLDTLQWRRANERVNQLHLKDYERYGR